MKILIKIYLLILVSSMVNASALKMNTVLVDKLFFYSMQNQDQFELKFDNEHLGEWYLMKMNPSVYEKIANNPFKLTEQRELYYDRIVNRKNKAKDSYKDKYFIIERDNRFGRYNFSKHYFKLEKSIPSGIIYDTKSKFVSNVNVSFINDFIPKPVIRMNRKEAQEFIESRTKFRNGDIDRDITLYCKYKIVSIPSLDSSEYREMSSIYNSYYNDSYYRFVLNIEAKLISCDVRDSNTEELYSTMNYK
jgi:hypothetical protein